MLKMQAIRRRLHGEHGQSMVVFVLMMTALIGVVGLVIDGSNLQENRRKLQNAADAAAFAGAYDLPNSPGSATSDSLQWLTKNGSGSSEVVSNSVSTNVFSNDTMTVSLRRNVPFSFAQVLGLSSSNVTATAKVQVQSVTGQQVPTNASGPDVTQLCRNYMACPYAVWAWRQTDMTAHQVGDIVTFRDNSWVGANVNNSDTRFGGNANNFKGFLRLSASPPVLNVGDNVTSGGNACGQEPTSGLVNAYNNNQPIVLPIFDSETGNGSNTDFHLAGFVALDLHVAGNDGSFQCPGRFQGKIIEFQSVSQYLKTGGTTPGSGYACGTGLGACKAKVTQ
jgi:Flp pilus assembly protein TadG